MDEAIIGHIEEPLAQFEGTPDAAGEKAPADRPSCVAIEKPRGEQGMRVEHRKPERAVVGALQRDETAGCERLGCGIHLHFVRVNPWMPAFGAPVSAGEQRDPRAGCRIVRCGLQRGYCIGAHPPYVVSATAGGHRGARRCTLPFRGAVE